MSGRAYGFDSRQPHHVGAKSAPLRFKAVPFGAALKLRFSPLLLLSNSNPLRWASSWFWRMMIVCIFFIKIAVRVPLVGVVERINRLLEAEEIP